MELFAKLFSSLLVFVYHCFDRIVIHGYLSGLSRPEQVVYFFRYVVGVPVVGKEVLRQRTNDYQNWVEAFARNHQTPIEWAEKGVRKDSIIKACNIYCYKISVQVSTLFYLQFCHPTFQVSNRFSIYPQKVYQVQVSIFLDQSLSIHLYQ